MKTYTMDDVGAAQRMYDMFGNDLLYHKSPMRWFARSCSKCKWEEDKPWCIMRRAKLTVDAIHDYVDSLPESKTKDKWDRYALSCGNTYRLKNIIRELKMICILNHQ